jgi:large subunit ribosomal protein L9
MRVILREDLDKLGQAGEVVSVRDGFGRNYLLPRGLAVVATEEDVARVEHEKRMIAARNLKIARDLQGEVARLSQVSVSIARAVGEGDRLYGSVTSRDIAEALAEKGIPIDSKKIQLDEPLKQLGTAEVSIKVGPGALAKIKVDVVKKQ